MKKQKTTKKDISKTKVKKKSTKEKPKKKIAQKTITKTTKKSAKNTTATDITKKAEKKVSPPQKKREKKNLEELTIAELKTLAKELSISLKRGLKKADIIKVIGKTKVKKRPEQEKKAIKKVIPLPAGYGENKLASIPVTPTQVYTYWEITEDTLSQYSGSLNLKVINTNTKAFFYMPISERIGEQFINVRPAGEYTVEIGVINYKGEFVRILKSIPVETPVADIAPVETTDTTQVVGGLPEEFFKIPESISSY